MVIQAIFWIAVGLMLLGALVALIAGVVVGGFGYALGIFVGLLIAVPSAVFVVRLYCETLIGFFRILDALYDIKQVLERQSTGAGPADEM